MGSDFRVLDVARQVVDELETLLDASGRRLLHAGQLRKAVGSIPFNIREGYGRGEGDDRKRFLLVARASAEEVDERLLHFARASSIASSANCAITLYPASLGWTPSYVNSALSPWRASCIAE